MMLSRGKPDHIREAFVQAQPAIAEFVADGVSGVLRIGP